MVNILSLLKTNSSRGPLILKVKIARSNLFMVKPFTLYVHIRIYNKLINSAGMSLLAANSAIKRS